MGPITAPHRQQCRIPRHPPPELGHQDQFLATLLHILGSDIRHDMDRGHDGEVRAIEEIGAVQEGCGEGSIMTND